MYALYYDPHTGVLLGAVKNNQQAVPRDNGNRDWQEFLDWNAAQPAPLDLADLPRPPRRRPRPLADIQADVDRLLAPEFVQRLRVFYAKWIQVWPAFDPAIAGDELAEAR